MRRMVWMFLPLFLYGGVVAKIGDREITEEELEGQKVEDYVKREVFYLAAKDEGIEDSLEASIHAKEMLFLIRALYTETVDKSTHVSDFEAYRFWKTKGKRVKVRRIFTRSFRKIWEAWRELKKGRDFDSVARQYCDDERLRKKGGEAGWAVASVANPRWRNVALKLKKNEFSYPFFSRGGWNIVMVEDVRPEPKRLFRDEKDGIKMRIKRVIMRRKAERHVKLLEKIARIRYDEDGIEFLTKKAPYMFSGRTMVPNINEEDKKRVLAYTSFGVYTIGDLMRDVKASGKAPRYRDEKDVKEYIKWMILYQLLYEEARRKGIHLRKAKEIENMRKEMVVKAFREKHIRKPEVTDEKLKEYYRRHRDKYYEPERREAYIIETKTKEEIEDIRRRALKGEDFGNLAKLYSIHKTARFKGRLGFVKKGQYEEEIDKAIFSTPEGRISKPFKTKRGWAIVKVKKVRKGRSPEFEKVKGKVKRDYIQDFTKSQEDSLFETFSRKYHVQIFNKEEK